MQIPLDLAEILSPDNMNFTNMHDVNNNMKYDDAEESNENVVSPANCNDSDYLLSNRGEKDDSRMAFYLMCRMII